MTERSADDIDAAVDHHHAMTMWFEPTRSREKQRAIEMCSTTNGWNLTRRTQNQDRPELFK